MLRLKSCPRCRGDVRTDKDHYGWYEECLQCGYLRDLEAVVKVAPEKKLSKLPKQGNRLNR